MATNTEEMAGSRQEIQSYLAGSRAEMETLLTDSISQILQPRPGTNLTAQAIYWQRRTVELHREFMDLLKDYMESGGTVLAVPIYISDAVRLGGEGIRPSRIHLLSDVNQRFEPGLVPLHLQHLLDHPSNGLWVHGLAVQNQEGNKTHLERINGPNPRYPEDERVWKWLFCELRDGEDLNTVVTEKERWGWGGTFTWGPPLEIGEQWGWGRLLNDEDENVVLLT